MHRDSEDLPTVESQGELEIGSYRISYYQLSNGEQVIDLAGLRLLLEFIGADAGGETEVLSLTRRRVTSRVTAYPRG